MGSLFAEKLSLYPAEEQDNPSRSANPQALGLRAWFRKSCGTACSGG